MARNVRSLALAAGAILLVFWSGPPAAARQGNEKQVVVTVMNLRTGNPVSGVTAAALAVKEDGNDVEVLKVEPATAPMSVVLLADNTSAMIRYGNELKATAKGFVTAFMEKHAGSSLGLWTYAGAAVSETKFLTERDKLVDEAGKLRPRDAASSARQADMESSLLEAIAQASRELAKRPETRRVIVSFNTITPTENSKLTKQQVYQELLKANTTWFAATLVDGGTSGSLRENVMSEVLPYSGGLRLTVQSIDKLEPAVKAIADALASQYLVTYKRGSGSPKEIDIQVKGEGLRAFYPHWAPK